MDLLETIVTFKNGLMWIGLSVLVAIVGGCVAAWLHHSTRGMEAWWRGLRTWFDKIVFIGLFAACVLIGGTKTNSPPLLQKPFPSPLPQAVVQEITEGEIAQGWRLESITTNDAASYTMPDGVLPSFNWHRRGTFGEWARLDLGDFTFPLGTNDETFSSFSVFNDGRIRPTPRDAVREICAVGVPMLAMQGASRFWVADAAAVAGRPPYQAKLLTWENFFLNADTNTPVSAQIELFPNGDFTTRSNNVEQVYRRVAYFDWDGDGLENSVDPDPLVAGPDAHGTNAEWYNTVCSNILSAVTTSCDPPDPNTGGTQLVASVELSWREGVNSNAYYFVDVVTTNGLAPIYFTGNRASRLGNPVVVANAFETNRVPLLIGIDYAITSPVPFMVSYPMNYMYPQLETNTPCRASIRWPLDFSVTPDGSGCRVVATPYDPGCEFQWPIPTRTLTCGCTTSGGWIGFNCGGNGDCGCHGCAVTGCAMLEYASFELPSIWCGCWYENPEAPGQGEATNSPSVSVSFSRPVVFYEDAYTNVPNEVIAKHSTNTTLAVSVYGGESGGMLYISASNVCKLVRTAGDMIAFPYAAFIPPHGGASLLIEYGAETHSDSEGDISVRVSLLGDSGNVVGDSASVTAVKVLLEAQYGAPADGNKLRHIYGVNELVACKWQPMSLSLDWNTDRGEILNGGPFTRFRAPMSDGRCVLVASVGDVSFPLHCSILEPESYFCERVEKMDYGLGENVAGGVGMSLELYIKPLTVSFGNIALQEVPTATGDVGGYFLNDEFTHMYSHTRDNCAGEWHNVGSDNLFMLSDEAALRMSLPRITPEGTLTNDTSFGWSNGTIVWTIPLGWDERNRGEDDLPAYTNSTPEEQSFLISSNGTTGVVKAGHYVFRGTNTYITTGRIVK